MSDTKSESITCEVCGTPLRPTDRYCPSCGASNLNFMSDIRSAPATDYQVDAPGSPARTSEHTTASSSPVETPVTPFSNRNTWLILAGIALVFLVICCCCVLLIAVAANQDGAFREELEGTVQLLELLT